MTSVARVALIIVVLVLATCATAPSAEPVPAPPAARPREVDRGSVQARLFDIADAAMARIDAASDAAVAASPSATSRAEIRRRALEIDVALISAVSGADLEMALVDVVLTARAQRAALEAWLAARPADASEQLLGEAMRGAEEHVVAGVDDLIAFDEREEFDALLSGGPTTDRSERSLLGNAPRRPGDESHLLAERGLYLLQRLPALARANAELAASAVATMPEVQSGLAELQNGRASIEALSASVNSLRATADDVEVALKEAKGIDVQGLTAFAGELRGAAAEIRATLPDAHATISDLKQALEAAERVTTALKEMSKGPDGKPLDLTALSGASDRFATASSDLRRAIAEANSILASDESTRRLEEIARTGRISIDHVIWRLGQLLVIGASLAVVIRIVWILTRPRVEGAPRTARH